MRLSIYKQQCEVNRSISSVWEAMRELTGYSDRRIANIHKENEDTWYFTFYLEKGKFSRIMSLAVSGKAYSKEDSLTKIEVKSGSYLATVISTVACILFIIATSFASGIVLNMIMQVLLIGFVSYVSMFIHNRESKLNVDEFIRKLDLKDCIIDKEHSSREN